MRVFKSMCAVTAIIGRDNGRVNRMRRENSSETSNAER
jgi:hypothetical protein